MVFSDHGNVVNINMCTCISSKKPRKACTSINPQRSVSASIWLLLSDCRNPSGYCCNFKNKDLVHHLVQETCPGFHSVCGRRQEMFQALLLFPLPPTKVVLVGSSFSLIFISVLISQKEHVCEERSFNSVVNDLFAQPSDTIPACMRWARAIINMISYT